MVTLQHQLVVVSNLSRNACIADSAHRWDKVVASHILADIIHEILNHRVLRLSLNGTLAGSTALRDVRIAACLEIDQTTVLLELCHLTFHFTQLGMN